MLPHIVIHPDKTWPADRVSRVTLSLTGTVDSSKEAEGGFEFFVTPTTPVSAAPEAKRSTARGIVTARPKPQRGFGAGLPA